MFLSALDSSGGLPSHQSLMSAAIVVVFAYLVPLLTMEINYFRLAAYKSRRRQGREEAASGEKKQRREDPASAEDGTEAAVAASADAGEDGRISSFGGESFVENDEAAGGAESTNSRRAAVVAGDENDDGVELTGEVELTNSQRTTVVANGKPKNPVDADDDSRSSSSSSAVAHLLNDVARASQLGNKDVPPTDPALRKAYGSIRIASCQAILSSLVVYSSTAAGISLNTRGLDEKVIAIVVGCSQFLAALMVFIVSAKVPQWIGVYHQGHIRLVKCSSNYSQRFETVDLDDDANLRELKSSVRLGVWFHFSKLYITLMPFYCGVRPGTIPLSMAAGALFGFILMWAVFVVHEKYIHHRNTVSFLTIFLLSIISSLTFTRGMAWIQVVWKLNILGDEDTLMVISFFTWLVLCAVVHTLFMWHTLRTEESEGVKTRDENGNAISDEENEDSRHTSGTDTPNVKGKNKSMRRSSSYGSYSSFVFDPRTHFKDGKCQFADHPDLEDDFTNELTSEVGLPLNIECDNDEDGEDPGSLDDFCIETKVEEKGNVVMEFDSDEIIDDAAWDVPTTPANAPSQSDRDGATKKHCRGWCEVCVCHSPEYQNSSCFWKLIVWIKIVVITLSYLLCLYFVAVSIGATKQIRSTRAGLPAVYEALYNHMNEGPVCAFNNRGPDSDIVTFEDKEAAHAAGYLVVHCGACGACSTWENLVVEYATRDDMAALANECAKEALFGGGDDALTECLMKPEIGFEYHCAVCWQVDILCTKAHCAFIFLQSQMTNNVGNFAVGEDEITSASCEEAHCEVGQFVPCSGATRRRMNIVSSISRPGDQQCGIVDVESWEDLFFGSGVA